MRKLREECRSGRREGLRAQCCERGKHALDRTLCRESQVAGFEERSEGNSGVEVTLSWKGGRISLSTYLSECS